MDTSFTYIQQSMKYLLYITVALLVLFIILLIINYTVTPISFLSFISGTEKEEPPKEEVPNKSETFALNRPLNNDVKLDIKAENYSSNNFTLSFDCYVSRNYKSIDVPRVLFYFSNTNAVSVSRNSDLKETKITDASNNGLDKQPNVLTIDNSDIPSKFINTNFIIYLDPIRNDMKIGIVLQDTTNKKYVEILPTVKNVPIEQPFQITFILGDTFAEVYRDKKLLFTHKIGSIVKKDYPAITNLSFVSVPNNRRTDLTDAPSLYGPISFIGNTVRVGNIQFFTSKLDGKYVRTLTNDTLTPEFFKRI